MAKSSKGRSPLFLLHLPGYGWWLLLAANKNSSKKPVLKAWILRYATTSFADDTRGGTMSTGAVISRKQKAAFQSECTSLLGHRACGQKSPDCLTATPRASPPPGLQPATRPLLCGEFQKGGGSGHHSLLSSCACRLPTVFLFISVCSTTSSLNSLCLLLTYQMSCCCCLRTISGINLPYIRLLGPQWDHSLEYSLGSKLFENLFSPAAQLPSNSQPCWWF